MRVPLSAALRRVANVLIMFGCMLFATPASAITTVDRNEATAWASALMVDTLSTGNGQWATVPAIRNGSVANVYRSPFDSSGGTPSVAGASEFKYYVNSSGSPAPGSATLLFDGKTQSAFSFLWGSPDDYNDVTFYNGAGSLGTSIWTLMGALYPKSGAERAGAIFVSITDFLFDRIVFSSPTTPALEFASISTIAAVPVPAGLPLLGAGLGMLALLRTRSKRRVPNAG
jgi:hypothetical protein